MKITPIAFDSLSARSMATLVETKDVKIFIDPEVAPGPSRYGLPHRVELDRKAQHWNAIKKNVARCEVLIVTHYHYDHHFTTDLNRRERITEIFRLCRIKGREGTYCSRFHGTEGRIVGA